MLCAAGATAVGVSIACAQTSPAENRHVTASLVAETRTVVPGRPFQIALRQQIEPGWHTYWSNPGDSGLPTTIEWELPRDFTANPIVWPTPKRLAYGPVVDYGYENETLLPVTIDVPSNLPPGRDVKHDFAIDRRSRGGEWIRHWQMCADRRKTRGPVRIGFRLRGDRHGYFQLCVFGDAGIRTDQPACVR